MRIDNASPQSLSSQPDGSPPRQDADVGLWRGATVQVAADANDILTDAAEEISFAHSEHVESHKLEEREIESPPPLELPSIEAINAYLEAAAHEVPEDKLRQFVDDLKRQSQQGREGSGQGQSAAGPREEARRQFRGVTEQFLALSYAAQQLAREGGHGALLDEVRGALEDLHDESGSHIRADFNSIDAAAAFGAGDGTRIQALQAAYRDAVLGGQDLSSMLRGALERFGDTDYRSAVRHLIRALGDDLASIQGSSAEPARLNAVLQDLYQLEVLATMLDGCQALTHKMGQKHGLTTANAGVLLQDIVSASGERWSNAGRFNAIADKHGAYTPSPRVTFLNSVRALVKSMPIKVFADTDSRSNVLDAAQGALDSAIALEEEQEEQE